VAEKKSLLYFVVRVRCRRTESSRSLSHLLMSFLLLPVSTEDYGNGIPRKSCGNPVGIARKLYKSWAFELEWETAWIGMGMTPYSHESQFPLTTVM